MGNNCPTCGQEIPVQDHVNVDLSCNIAVMGGELVFLTPTQALLLQGLAERTPLWTTKKYLMDAMYGLSNDEEPEEKIVDVFICKIRQAMKHTPYTIQTLHGGSVRLVKKGREAA